MAVYSLWCATSDMARTQNLQTRSILMARGEDMNYRRLAVLTIITLSLVILATLSAEHWFTGTWPPGARMIVGSLIGMVISLSCIAVYLRGERR